MENEIKEMFAPLPNSVGDDDIHQIEIPPKGDNMGENTEEEVKDESLFVSNKYRNNMLIPLKTLIEQMDQDVYKAIKAA
ncbi:MAG: hypothetical protein ACRC0X_09525, partial [Brevinema sp.]